MELNSGEEWVSSAEDEGPTLFPRDVHISADVCEEIITKSKTVSKGLLRHVQTDAETVSAFVARNVLTVEEGDLLRRETSPPSDRLNDILRPALIRGGNSALQRFYWCLRDTQDDGRLGHKQLADAIKIRVDKRSERERRKKFPGQRHLEHPLASSQGSSQIGTGVGVSGPDAKSTTTPHRHLHKHGSTIAEEMLRPDVERDVISHPLSKQNRGPQHNLNPSSDQQLLDPQQSLSASNLKKNNDVLSNNQSLYQGDIESPSEGSFVGRPHVPSKKTSSAMQPSHAVNIHSSSQDEAQLPLRKSLLSSSQQENFKTFKETRDSILSGLREAILGPPGPNREGSLSPVGVSKLLFPSEDPPVILSSPDVTNLSGSGGVSSAAILDLWMARSLVTDNALYDISLALLSQPLLGKHLKCITDWTGSYETSDPLIQAFSKGVGHSWPTFAEKMGFSKSDLKKPNSKKVSKRWFFESVWKLPHFERAEGERLLTAALRMAGLDDELMNFTNKLSKGLKIVENRAHTMSQLGRDSEKLTSDTTTTVTELPTDKTGSDTETPTDTGVDTKDRSTLSLPKLEATSGGERVKPSSETTESGRDSGDQRKRPTWGDSSATSYSGSATSYVSDVTSVGDDAYLYGDKYFESPECKIYDRNAILLGADLVPPRIKRRSPLSGLYENMKAVPFDRELFETLLISCGEIMSLSDENSRSALFLACELNNAQAVTLLLQYGANPDIQDDYGRTCLHLPGVYWNESLLMSLLGPSSNVNVNIDTFETHVTPLCVACSSKECAAVRKLLDQGADPKGHPESLYPPLIIAAQNGSVDILRLLIQSGAHLEAENVDGYTALHMAIFEGHQHVVELLLEEGCDVNHKAKNDCTPLNCAAADGYLPILKLLLGKGANPNSIRTFSRVTGLPSAKVSALADAALGCHIGVVQALVHSNADVHFRSDDYLSVLGYACIGGSCDVVGFLMTETDCGKDVKQLALPLNSAMKHENFKCAKLMLDLAGGKETILPKIRYDVEFVKNVNTVYALYGGSDVINFGDMVPKSVGSTDDSFQKYRTVHRSTVIGDIKIIELIKPDELPHYSELVQYVADRHIIMTAELMYGSEGVKQQAASAGSNDIMDFVLDYQGGNIRPQELVFRMNKANRGIQDFFHTLVDFVHLLEYARHFDNRIALQYFQDIQLRQEMGLPSGVGSARVAPSSAFHSTFTSQDLKALQGMRGSGSLPGLSNVHGYGELEGLAGGFNPPKRSVFEGVGRQVGYSSSDVPFSFDTAKKTSSEKMPKTQLPPKEEKSKAGRHRSTSKSPPPTNQPVQDKKSTRKVEKPKASQEVSEPTSVPMSDSQAGRERSTIDKKLLAALSKSQLGSESGTEDDDQSTVVPESSKGEYNSSETPPAVGKEPIPVRTEYPIDVSKNSHQALLDIISNDSEVVRVWMPLLRRLRPPLLDRELENIRKSSTGSQAKASQALNMWARITQGPTVPTWNEIADGLKRQKRHDLSEHIRQFIESQDEETQVEEDPQQLLTPKILGDDKEELVSQGDPSSLSYPQTSATGSHPQTSATGSHPQTSGTGSHPQTSATGSHPQTSATGSHPQTSATGSHPQTSGTGSHPQTSATGSHPQTSATGSLPQTIGTGSHSQTSATGSHPQASGTDAIAYTTSTSSNRSELNLSSDVPVEDSNTPEVVPQIPAPVGSSSVLTDFPTNIGPAFPTASLLDPSVPIPTSDVPVSISMNLSHCSPTIPLDSTYVTVVASHDPIPESTSLTSDVVQDSMGSFSESVLHTKPQSTPNIAIPDSRLKIDASQLNPSQSYAETVPSADSFLPNGKYSHSTSSISHGAFGTFSNDVARVHTHIDSTVTDGTGPHIITESTHNPSAASYQSITIPVPVCTVSYFPGERNLQEQNTAQTESTWSASGPANSTALGPSDTAHHVPWTMHHTKHSQTADKTQTLHHDLVHLPVIDLTNRGQKFIIREIGCKVKTKWPILSRFLGLDQGDIDRIKSGYSTAEEKGVRALQKWVSSQPCEATWSNLVFYLKRINRPDLCQVIYDYFSEFDNLDLLREKVLSSHTVIADLEDKEQFLRNVSIFLHANSRFENCCETLALRLNVPVQMVDPHTEDNVKKCYCVTVLQLWVRAEPHATIGMLSVVLREMDCEGDLLSLQYVN